MSPGTGGTVTEAFNVSVPYSAVVSHTRQLTSEKSKKKEAVTGAERISCSAWRPALLMSAAIMLRKCLTTAVRRNFVWMVQCATCTQNVFLILVSTSLSCKIGVVAGADGKVSLRTAILQGPLRLYKTAIVALESGSQLVQVNNKNWRVMWAKWKVRFVQMSIFLLFCFCVRLCTVKAKHKGTSIKTLYP